VQDHLVKIAARHVFSAGGSLLHRRVDVYLNFLAAGIFFFANIEDFGSDSPRQFLGSSSRLGPARVWTARLPAQLPQSRLVGLCERHLPFLGAMDRKSWSAV